MSLLKSELKQLVAHEIGVRMDDAREAIHRDAAVLEGKQNGLNEGAKAVEALCASVDKDVEDGKMDLEQATLVKRYLVRGVHALQTMAQQIGNQRITAAGRAQGVEHGIALLKGVIDEEKKKAVLLQAAAAAAATESAGNGATSEDHTHVSIKAQRLAEEQAEEAARADHA